MVYYIEIESSSYSCRIDSSSPLPPPRQEREMLHEALLIAAARINVQWQKARRVNDPRIDNKQEHIMKFSLWSSLLEFWTYFGGFWDYARTCKIIFKWSLCKGFCGSAVDLFVYMKFQQQLLRYIYIKHLNYNLSLRSHMHDHFQTIFM